MLVFSNVVLTMTIAATQIHEEPCMLSISPAMGVSQAARYFSREGQQWGQALID